MSETPMFSDLLPERLSKSLRESSGVYKECDIENLLNDIQAHLSRLAEALSYNEFLDIGTARKIAVVLEVLLNQYDQFSEKEKALIFGAARYFVNDLDVEQDTKSIIGLDDDVQVLNHVLDQIGCSDLRVVL